MLLTFLITLQPAAAWSAAGPALRLSEPSGAGLSLAQQAETNAHLAAALGELREQVIAGGSIEVAVKTAVAFAPESLLNDVERLQQRRDIAQAAETLRKALPEAKKFEALRDLPYVILRLDAAGLARLETIPGLVRITAGDALNWMRDFVQLRTSAATARMQIARGASPKAGPTLSPRIVGGTTAGPGSHPFQVALLARSISNNFRAQFCGGTLVAARYVVTAAHCTMPDIARKAQVLVGTQRLDGTGRRINVKRVSIHPRWALSSLAGVDYDVAVWELATPVSGIAFATLASTQPSAAGTLLRTSGWGTRTYGVRDKPMDLMQVDVPFVPASGGSCGEQGRITPRMICAGEEGKDSCQGDSGGPLTIDRGAGFNELVGIVSFGDGGCGAEGWPGVYANVADSEINSFIRNIVFPPPKTIAFAAATSSVGEGERRVTLTLQRSTTEGTARVRYATADGTAVNRADYRARSGTVSFRRGEATATVTISLTNDRVKESDETFTVTLSQPSTGWTFGSTTTATVTITDND